MNIRVVDEGAKSEPRRHKLGSHEHPSEEKDVAKVLHFVILRNDNNLNRRINWMGISSEEEKTVRENRGESSFRR